MTETRPQPGAVEERSAPEALTLEGKRLRGVIPYNVESRDLGGWREVMEPGCLRGTDLTDLVATVDHGGLPIGRYPGTLTVEDRDNGLHWSVELPKSRSDVLEAVERGDLKSSSWRMIVSRDRWDGDTRHVEEVRAVRDVAVVQLPAYSSAVAELRSAPEPEGEQPEPEPPQEATVPEPEEKGGGGLTVAARNTPESRGAAQTGDIEARVLEAIKSVRPGESRNLTTTSASPIDVPELATFVWDRLYPESVMLQAGIRVISTSRESLLFPHVTAAVDPSWTSEGVEIVEGDPAWSQENIQPSKLAHRIRLFQRKFG